MPAANQFFELLLFYINCTINTDGENWTQREVLEKEQLMSSLNINDFNKNIDINRVKIEDFKRKNNTPYTALLCPLFEIRNVHGKEIIVGFENLIDFNKIVFNEGVVIPNTNNFDMYTQIQLINDQGFIIQNRPISFFIFKNPLFNKLYLYSLIHLSKLEECTFVRDDSEKNKIPIEYIKFRLFAVEKNLNVTFKATQGEVKEEYELLFPDMFLSHVFRIDAKEDGTFILKDKNTNDKNVFIKPLGKNNEGSILEQFCIKERKETKLQKQKTSQSFDSEEKRKKIKAFNKIKKEQKSVQEVNKKTDTKSNKIPWIIGFSLVFIIIIIIIILYFNK
ncbi:hypothetical protein CDIK_2453 [Cucumispora dikerogammari]|nr:hypothetical protein CDIK_2453 [Cucumispora dikerogammari]